MTPSDPLPPKLFFNKDVFDKFIITFLDIVNLSIEMKVFPDNQKIATIIPIEKNKSASRNDLNSFRPVSNLPYVSKLIEKVVEI